MAKVRLGRRARQHARAGLPRAVCLLLLACHASAGPDDDVADRVLAAFRAGSPLRPFVTLDPDPWFVADALCRRGQFDAASAFAAAEPRPLTAGLADYVAARREHPSSEDVYAAFSRARELLQGGKPADAVALIDRASPEDDVIGLRLRHLRADALNATGATREARDGYLEVAARARKLGWLRRTADTYVRAGTCSQAIGEVDAALAQWDAALELLTTLGHRSNETYVLNAIGVARFHREEYAASRDAHAKACQLSRETRNPAATAESLTLLGGAELMLGDYAAALSSQEESLALRERLGVPEDIVQTLQNLSLVHRQLGDLDRARADLVRAKELCEKGRFVQPLLLVLLALAGVEGERNDVAASDALLAQADALAERMGDAGLQARVQGSLGQNRRNERQWDAAERHFREALRLAEEAGSSQVAALAREALGQIACEEGRFADARALLREAADAGRALGNRPLVARCLSWLAQAHLRDGDAKTALALADEALKQGNTLTHGLSFEEGVQGRAVMPWHLVGVEAALVADDAKAMYRFVEGGRAGALLEALGGREAVRSVEIPAELAQAREGLAADVASATAAWEAARESGVLAKIRDTRSKLDSARADLQALDARIERRRRGVAAATALEPLPADQLQAQLRPDRVLVLYELGLKKEGLALVITGDRLRFVRLGPTADIEAACAKLRFDDTSVDPSAAVTRLRTLLVDPLQIPDPVHTVLVSPDGPLAFVPFPLLLGERAVSCVPSGSIAVHLAAEAGQRGTGVLAIGDPAHDGLAPLPGARAEAKAVGTQVLLGEAATETAFWKALSARPRWRAVHFACHGIFNQEHPTLSALALAPEPGVDGLLTVLDVGRHDIATDLVVLSGCETARGRVYGSEGVIGIVGAFTLAGSPHVLASLWPVDDEATSALMQAFYRAWDKGAGAAEALRTAQDAVRKEPRWRHPAYWAAWVLWGPS